MANFSLMMALCLLAGLSECQASDESNLILITELTHEDLAPDTWVEENAIQKLSQELEMPDNMTTNSTETSQVSKTLTYTALKELGALEEKLAATVRTLEETNKKLEASEMKLSVLNNMVTELNTEFQGRSQVAFSAVLPVDGTIGPANVLYPLVYRHVLSNIGGHYSPVTGYFTAPVNGVYFFTFTSFCWEASNANCGGSLYKNGNRIISWYDYNRGHPSSASNSAVLQLQAGDIVNVCLWQNKRISDNQNKYSSFSGFLLFPV